MFKTIDFDKLTKYDFAVLAAVELRPADKEELIADFHSRDPAVALRIKLLSRPDKKVFGKKSMQPITTDEPDTSYLMDDGRSVAITILGKKALADYRLTEEERAAEIDRREREIAAMRDANRIALAALAVAAAALLLK